MCISSPGVIADSSLGRADNTFTATETPLRLTETAPKAFGAKEAAAWTDLPASGEALMSNFSLMSKIIHVSAHNTLILALAFSFAGHIGMTSFYCTVGGTVADEIARERGEAVIGRGIPLSQMHLSHHGAGGITLPAAMAVALSFLAKQPKLGSKCFTRQQTLGALAQPKSAPFDNSLYDGMLTCLCNLVGLPLVTADQRAVVYRMLKAFNGIAIAFAHRAKYDISGRERGLLIDKPRAGEWMFQLRWHIVCTHPRCS